MRYGTYSFLPCKYKDFKFSLCGLSHCLINQHWERWQSLDNTQRQARELISGPCLSHKPKFLSFNGTQARAVTGLLTGPNTLRRHLHLIGMVKNLICRKCGVEDETSAHILCECEALASLRHVYLGSYFLEPKDIKNRSLGPYVTLVKPLGSHELTWAHRVCFIRPKCVGAQKRPRTQTIYLSIYLYFTVCV
jgi:hypothetical protein